MSELAAAIAAKKVKDADKRLQAALDAFQALSTAVEVTVSRLRVASSRLQGMQGFCTTESAFLAETLAATKKQAAAGEVR